MTNVFYIAVGCIVCIFFMLFAITSLRERARRAAAMSALAFALFGILWFGIYFAFKPAESSLLVMALIIVLAALLYYAPLRRKKTIHVDSITERVDERDIMFAREEYRPGTEKYEKYYFMRPEYKETDDRLRQLPHHRPRVLDASNESAARSADYDARFKITLEHPLSIARVVHLGDLSQ